MAKFVTRDLNASHVNGQNDKTHTDEASFIVDCEAVATLASLSHRIDTKIYCV
jgi:hypothetical protein